MSSVLLVHGGLWGEMDARRFWVLPGVVAGLRELGWTVLAPDRLVRAESWAADADHLSGALPDGPVTVIAGSNGCSAAVRLALSRPESVRGLLLAWPATGGDPAVDARTRDALRAGEAAVSTVDTLLAGETLRGVSDVELRRLRPPIGVLPSVPENPYHQHRTAEALVRLAPDAVSLPGGPEPPQPDFATHRPAFLATVDRFLRDADTASP